LTFETESITLLATGELNEHRFWQIIT